MTEPESTLTYATTADLSAYIEDVPATYVPLPDEGGREAFLTRFLERAERDIDRIVGPWPLYESGRKFDPEDLTAPQQEALKRATCAAAEYRIATGEGELIGAEDGIASVDGISFTSRPLARIGPKVTEELSGAGLILYSGTLPVDPFPVDLLPVEDDGGL